ncbi:MAG: hypothetical protein BWY74_01510 [Firmicutes bacterium ADurb.Bin419]|nr:MAG: hypothetical protein BWY74_01510 [Firmicutes bacterium ADurb.Bin419]
MAIPKITGALIPEKLRKKIQKTVSVSLIKRFNIACDGTEEEKPAKEKGKYQLSRPFPYVIAAASVFKGIKRGHARNKE